MENHHSLWTSSSSSEWKKSNPQIQHVCVSSDWFQTNFPNDISLNMHLFYNLISEFKKAGVFIDAYLLWSIIYTLSKNITTITTVAFAWELKKKISWHIEILTKSFSSFSISCL